MLCLISYVINMQLFENILDFKINLEKFNNESIDNSAKVFGKFSI